MKDKKLIWALMIFLMKSFVPVYGQNQNESPSLDETMAYLVDKISHNCDVLSYLHVYKTSKGWADITREYVIEEISYNGCYLIFNCSKKSKITIPVKELNIENIFYRTGIIIVTCESNDIEIIQGNGAFNYENSIYLNLTISANKVAEPPKIIKALKHACKLCGGRYDLF